MTIFVPARHVVIAAAGGRDPCGDSVIRSHESLLGLIRDYGAACMGERPELLAEIDKTPLRPVRHARAGQGARDIGALEGCRRCDEALAVIKGEMGDKP